MKIFNTFPFKKKKSKLMMEEARKNPQEYRIVA